MNDLERKISALLTEPISNADLQDTASELRAMPPNDAGALLTQTPSNARQLVWDLLDENFQGELIAHIDQELVGDLFASRSAGEIANVIEKVTADDDLTDIIQQLPDGLTDEVLDELGAQDRARIKKLLIYPPDTAGGLMDTHIISVRPETNIDAVLRYLRRHQKLPDNTDQIFVVGPAGHYLGSLALQTLLVSDPQTPVAECMEIPVKPLSSALSTHDVAQIFERYDLISMPVLDTAGVLLGRITIDDIVDVIIDEADHSMLGMAGLNEEFDTFAPIFKTARHRALWLGANLVTALVASFVINLFEDTIAKVVALAILMPIVASMGGVAGSQSLTLIIRSLAQGNLSPGNARYLLKREVAVSLLNGLLWALLIAIGVSLIFQDHILGIIIALALIINMAIAAIAGTLLPQLLKSLSIDPAIAGTVVLTTITDVVGFITFLGMATYFYG
ncbi:MAG: magnesium transporter [Pseudomonadales bacterium]